MRVIRTSGQDPVPMQQMQGQPMQPMPTMPELGYEQREFYRGAYVGMKMQVQMQQQQQSTYALYSTGSPTLHQAHEQHQERTGGQTGLVLHNMYRRQLRTFSEWKHDDYSDEENIEEIGACRAVE